MNEKIHQLQLEFKNLLNDVVSRSKIKLLFQSDWDIAYFSIIVVFVGMILLLVVLVVIHCCCGCCCDGRKPERRRRVGMKSRTLGP